MMYSCIKLFISVFLDMKSDVKYDLYSLKDKLDVEKIVYRVCNF